MHALNVIRDIKKFLMEKIVDDMEWPTKKGEETQAINIYEGYLPPKKNGQRSLDELDKDIYPFILIRFLDDDDDFYKSNKIGIAFYFGTYSDDEQNGWRDVLALATKTKTLLRRANKIGCTAMVDKAYTALFEEQRKPTWHATMQTTFVIPQIQSERSELFGY